MKLKDIVEKALEIIGDESIDINTPSPKLAKLTRCGNYIYHEICEEYSLLLGEEEIEFDNGRANYENFSKYVKNIISIYANEQKLEYNVFPLYVKAGTFSGKAIVKYNYHASTLNLEDTAELPPQFTAEILSNGVAAEYLFRSGLIEEAAVYKNRYDTSVINLTRVHKSFDLKVARFL